MRKIVLVLLVGASAIFLHAEEKSHRQWFQEALAAAETGNLGVYASSMVEALEANTTPQNRPFMLYHLARARALQGDEEGALEALQAIWDEDIERLLVFYVDHDPAFEEIRSGDGWKEIAGRVTGLDLEIDEVREGIYSIDGAGSWILAMVTEDGWLLVDTGYAQASDAIRTALDTSSTRQVAVIINTHEHEDHVGGNERFGGNAVIVAHPKTLEVLSAEQEFIPGVNLPPKDEAALPNVLTSESLSIPAEEERVHVIAVPAHSGSDLAVVFEDAGIIHMGDGFFPEMTERIFPGDDPDEFLRRMDEVLGLVDDEAIVYSGHSAPVPVSRLRQAVENTAAIREWTLDRIEAGISGEVLLEAAAEAGHPADWVAYFEKLETGEE